MLRTTTLLLLALVGASAQAPVRLEFFGEAFWPECQSTVTIGLNETIGAAGVVGILNFTFVPWGNAYYNIKKCGTSGFDKQKGMDCWVKACNVKDPPADCFDKSLSPVLCQHGDGECEADAIEACVIDQYPNPLEHVAFISCYEGVNGADKSFVAPCAEASGMDVAKIMACASGPEGAKLDQIAARATVALGLAKLGTPWVMLNGKYLENPGTYGVMLNAVCAAYTGAKPAGCASAATAIA